MRAVLDTGCTAGNWVSLDTLDDLGIKQYLLLTEIEEIGAQAAGGAVVKACGAVNLTWRGIPGGQVRNCSRNFKMRFLVIDSEPAPFQILIGSESIWKCGILQAPIFMLKHHHRSIVGLPRETEAKDNGGEWAINQSSNRFADVMFRTPLRGAEREESETERNDQTRQVRCNGGLEGSSNTRERKLERWRHDEPWPQKYT
jgi:hypothetical protein